MSTSNNKKNNKKSKEILNIPNILLIKILMMISKKEIILIDKKVSNFIEVVGVEYYRDNT